MLTDSHCHLSNEYYEDIELIINNALENKVNRYITSGYDQKSNEEIVVITNRYDNLYGTLGIHPHSALDYNESWLEYIKKKLDHKNIIAVGEIGLDYYYGKETKDEQKVLFHKMLKLAEERKKAVVIHSRDATEDTINILKEYNLKGVIHSFSGSYETAQIYIKMGYILGINGTVTFKNSKLIDVLKRLDLENIILETDCPYLTPEPNRGKKNEPKNILDIAKYLSKELKIPIEEIALQTEKNIQRTFDI
jgi:TatD DNase family protein